MTEQERRDLLEFEARYLEVYGEDFDMHTDLATCELCHKPYGVLAGEDLMCQCDTRTPSDKDIT